MKVSIPKKPEIFLKPPSALIANNGVVILPKVSKRIDYEVELEKFEESRHSICGFAGIPFQYIDEWEDRDFQGLIEYMNKSQPSKKSGVREVTKQDEYILQKIKQTYGKKKE